MQRVGSLVGFRFCKSVIRYNYSRFIFWLRIYLPLNADLLVFSNCIIKKQIVYCLNGCDKKKQRWAESKFIQPALISKGPPSRDLSGQVAGRSLS